MKTIFILSFFLIISCGKNSSSEKSLTRALQPTETIPPDLPDEPNECEGLMSAEVIIDDLNWYVYSDARNYEEYLNSKTVGKLYIPSSRARCTAFIINDNTIMTNNHCVGNASEAVNVTFSIRDTNQSIKTYNCSDFIMTSLTLDYTLLGCNEKVGMLQGHNYLSKATVNVMDEIYIIQENCDYLSNPSCMVNKMISIGVLEQVGNYTLGHNADTLGGSSGSPIYLSSSNKVIGIHNAGRNPSGSLDARNFGIPMKKIISDIQTRNPSVKIFQEKEQIEDPDSCE